jgi:2-polyprenyl-6-methoxyphenol hydroxylase-like FAD-dependent oxidoreductase
LTAQVGTYRPVHSAHRHVLIAGASIAGPALAFWLVRYGFKVTIVERAPKLRLGGQNIDVRAAGREVAARMRLIDDIAALNTSEKGIRFVDGDLAIKGEFAADAFPDGNGPTAELEILRGDLAQLLVKRTEEAGVEYIFGDYITGVEESARAVTVQLNSGKKRTFDLVVAADGLHSRTRDLVFPKDEVYLKPLNLYIAYYTMPKIESDTPWATWSTLIGGRSIFLRPDASGRTRRACVCFISPPAGYTSLSVDEQKAIVRRKFEGASVESDRIINGLDYEHADFYFEQVAQVYAQRWSKGRVALVGDAACAPSPLSGMGTSLSFVGAYLLAGELAKSPDDHVAAFAGYEERMRPFASSAQKLPPGGPRVLNPTSQLGLSFLFGILRFASFLVSLGGMRYLIGALGRWSPSFRSKVDLPDYTAYEKPARRA